MTTTDDQLARVRRIAARTVADTQPITVYECEAIHAVLDELAELRAAQLPPSPFHPMSEISVANVMVFDDRGNVGSGYYNSVLRDWVTCWAEADHGPGVAWLAAVANNYPGIGRGRLSRDVAEPIIERLPDNVDV